jgi:ACS family hexuronate transporter-like MFS transporter
MNWRWIICGLLFLATTLNYVDRQIFASLKPLLDHQLGWSNEEFGNVHSAFFAAYALGLLAFGRVVDRVGVKLGYALSIGIWSLAALGHAFANSIFGFFVARITLGLGEGGNFPSAVKAVALWFPRRERALATSLFMAGTNIGALVAPILVTYIALPFGWRYTFVVAGLAGLAWLALWLPLFSSPARSRRVSAAELAHIREADGDNPSPDAADSWPWAKILARRETWSFVVAKLLTDPVWWFYTVWLPDWFATTRGLPVERSWPHLLTIYSLVTVLGVVGGWLPGHLCRRGWGIGRARKTGLLVFALIALPVALVPRLDLWPATLLIGVAAAAHQAWSANLLSTVSDMFPRQAVASVIGLGGMAGAVAGIVAPKYAGRLLDAYQAAGDVGAGYARLFSLCAGIYLVTFLVHHQLAPRLAPLAPATPK